MGERALVLVDVEGAAIGDIGRRLVLIFRRRAVEPVAGGEAAALGLHQLRRHVAVRGVHDDALGMLAQRVGLGGAIHRPFDIGNQLPGTDQLIAKFVAHTLRLLSGLLYFAVGRQHLPEDRTPAGRCEQCRHIATDLCNSDYVCTLPARCHTRTESQTEPDTPQP
ncbi:hypothetical protein D3C78_1530310 [compost metagenome]